MAKTIFCFICKKPIDVEDSRAIAKCCPEHDNDTNRQKMLETPTRQLLGIQDEGLQLLVKENQDGNVQDLEDIHAALDALKVQIAALPTEATTPTPVENTLQGGVVNEFGEII